MIRPSPTQSDSASRKQHLSTGLFFDWIILVLLLIVSRVEFTVFMLFLEAVSVREYCLALKPRLSTLCFARSSRATRASRATHLCPSGLVALVLDESRQSYVRGVTLSREPIKLQQAHPLLTKWHRYRAPVLSCDTCCWRAELGVRHADLRREAKTVTAKPASALLYDTVVWYLVWVCGRVGVCFVVGLAMRWVKKQVQNIFD